MKTLELKHLAPYLPYGLKGNLVNLEYFDSQINKELYRIETGLSENNKNYDITVVVGDCESVIADFKPILRPLSEYKFFEDILDEFSEHSEEQFEVAFFVLGGCDNKFDFVNYSIMELMFKHHLDVFGLIEQGLAIDINTLAQ